MVGWLLALMMRRVFEIQSWRSLSFGGLEGSGLNLKLGLELEWGALFEGTRGAGIAESDSVVRGMIKVDSLSVLWQPLSFSARPRLVRMVLLGRLAIGIK